MNIKNYISSGILEAYVLGELKESEKQEVERNADEYPEVYEEIRHIKEAFHIISIQSLKQAGILPEANQEHEKVNEDSVLNKSTKKFIETSLKNKMNVSNYLASAAVILAIVSSFAAADLYLELKNTQNQIESLKYEKQSSTEPVSEFDYEADLDTEPFSFLFTPDFKTIELYDLYNSIESHSRVFWNEKSHELFLQINHLPDPGPGKQFQLWAVIDEMPVNLGLIPVETEEDFIRMNRTKNASAFMITIEPEGGSKFPDYKSEIAYRSLIEY